MYGMGKKHQWQWKLGEEVNWTAGYFIEYCANFAPKISNINTNIFDNEQTFLYTQKRQKHLPFSSMAKTQLFYYIHPTQRINFQNNHHDFRKPETKIQFETNFFSSFQFKAYFNFTSISNHDMVSIQISMDSLNVEIVSRIFVWNQFGPFSCATKMLRHVKLLQKI